MGGSFAGVNLVNTVRVKAVDTLATPKIGGILAAVVTRAAFNANAVILQSHLSSHYVPPSTVDWVNLIVPRV